MDGGMPAGTDPSVSGTRDGSASAATASGDPASRSKTVTVHVPMKLRQCGGRKLVITPVGVAPSAAAADEGAVAPELSVPRRRRPLTPAVKALARAFRWQRLMDSGDYTSIAALAAAEGIDKSYVSKVLRLALLAPGIVELMVGTLADDEHHFRQVLAPFPIEWCRQRTQTFSLGCP